MFLFARLIDKYDPSWQDLVTFFSQLNFTRIDLLHSIHFKTKKVFSCTRNARPKTHRHCESVLVPHGIYYYHKKFSATLPTLPEHQWQVLLSFWHLDGEDRSGSGRPEDRVERLQTGDEINMALEYFYPVFWKTTSKSSNPTWFLIAWMA
jgi:hypothetical protein